MLIYSSGGSDAMQLYFDQISGNLLFRILGVDYQIAAPMPALTWIFFGVVYDSAAQTLKLYTATTTGAVTLLTTATSIVNAGDANTLMMFNNSFTNFFFLGSVLSLKIWQAALTDTQVANERVLRPQYTTGINRWLPLLNNATAIRDWSGNGNTMTKAGTFTDQAPMPPAGFGTSPLLSL